MHGDKKKLKSECGRRSESVQHITAVHATRVSENPLKWGLIWK